MLIFLSGVRSEMNWRKYFRTLVETALISRQIINGELN